MKQQILKIVVCVLALTAVTACQTINEKRKIDYKSTRTLPPLDVPPDLSTPPGATAGVADATVPGSATYSGFLSEKSSQKQTTADSGMLPDYDGIRMERWAQTRWLVVTATPEELWPKLGEFVLKSGLIVDKENPLTGVIETDWAENRAKVGTGPQKLIAKSLDALYSTGTRDKYRIRLERGLAGATEIYLSHRSMVETITNSGGSETIGETKWQPGPSDPEMEVEMLRLLMAHLGVKGEKAQAVIASTAAASAEHVKLNRTETGVSLSLEQDLDRAWRLVGLALDRAGFTVQDRDRSKGIYYVRYIDPDKAQNKGFFRRLFSKKEKKTTDEYQVHLKNDNTGTEVEVLDKQGVLDKSPTSERILTLLKEHMK